MYSYNTCKHFIDYKCNISVAVLCVPYTFNLNIDWFNHVMGNLASS